MTSGNQRHLVIGKTVKVASIQNDELHLGLGDDWHIVVLNPFSLISESADTLVGAALLTFEERGTTEFLAFDNGIIVTVDMRDDAYREPEAMLLTGPETIVVWN
ncbi:hypothetical protein [Brevundimonas sp.]|jgi:hypothetical protein|uniref:hypothetical protein n=1 Tax=Brevundimonas sp. TaxID=1871086 RepID=UPI0037BF3AFB